MKITRIDPDYQPRYPQRLSPGQYSDLLAPDQQKRLIPIAASATLSAAALTSGNANAQDTDPDKGPGQRADRVAELLTRSCTGGTFWMEHTTFQRVKDKHGNPKKVPIFMVLPSQQKQRASHLSHRTERTSPDRS